MTPQVSVDPAPAIKDLDRWYRDVSEAKVKAYEEIVAGVAARVAPKVPVRTGRLKGAIAKSVSAKAYAYPGPRGAKEATIADIRLGTPRGTPYADPVHWDSHRVSVSGGSAEWSSDQSPKKWFLFRTVHPQAQPFPGEAGPFAPWIQEIVAGAVEGSFDKLDGRLAQ